MAVFETPQDGGVPVRRADFRAPLRFRLARLLLAFAGAGSLTYGLGSETTTERLVHDCGLPFLLLALTLPWWRRPRPDPYATEPPGERLAGGLKRAGVKLLMLASFGLIAHRSFELAGRTAAQHVSSIAGYTAAALGTAAVAGGLLAARGLPGQARRPERTLELMRALHGRRASRARLVAAMDRAGFDPNQGATGRPAPIDAYPGGARRTDKTTLRLRMALGDICTLRWFGSILTFSVKSTGETFEVPLAEPADAVPFGHGPAVPRRGETGGPAGPLAEIVWCRTTILARKATEWQALRRTSHHVYLLDDAGYVIAVVHGVSTAAGSVKVLAQHLGVPFHAYEITWKRDVRREIERLMFPRRSGFREFG